MKNNFSKYLKTDYITFKYAKGPSDKTGKEFHPYHEILLFLGGNAQLISENMHLNLKPHTLIVIPKETYHQFHITGNIENYKRCVFNFYDMPDIDILIESSMQRLLVCDTNETIRCLFSIMIEKTDETQNSAVIKSALVLLLDEISKNIPKTEVSAANSLTAKCIKYITEHIGEKITVGDIAKGCNASQSLLAHTFKEEMHISIYQFILKKRLITAHNKISAGEAATLAAIECGFNDYSGFYRQYRKMFNCSPSNREQNKF